jgi:hypothetical protein
VSFMRTSAAVLGTVLAAAFTFPASATVRISSDPGGQIGAYLQRFEALRLSGENVIIDGPCLSACTLVLGAIPRDQLCITSRARLGFHAAWRPDEFGRPVVSRAGTELMMTNYPRWVRDWIARRGGLSPHLIYLTGSELAPMYPACPDWAQGVAAGRDAGPGHVVSTPLTSMFASRRKARLKPLP